MPGHDVEEGTLTRKHEGLLIADCVELAVRDGQIGIILSDSEGPIAVHPMSPEDAVTVADKLRQKATEMIARKVQ